MTQPALPPRYDRRGRGTQSETAAIELDGSALAGAHSRREAGQRAQAIGLLDLVLPPAWNAGPPYWI